MKETSVLDAEIQNLTDAINNSIDPVISNKSPENTLVVVAMSGGVDSSVCAAWMHHIGYKVIGITLQLYAGGAKSSNSKACCAGRDIEDARRVAGKFGFPHYVFNYEDLFREEVVDNFVDSYVAGETPIPCVRCNQTVKFRDLLKVSKKLGADALVTGHYVRRVIQGDSAEMHVAVDSSKDQSYFLFTTTKEQLDYLRFPLGNFSKDFTRSVAKYFDLEIADKPDSQDICFVGGNKYADIVKKMRPESICPGEIVHIDGRVLGKHEGVIHYTIGQRRRLGIATGEPLYVVEIDWNNSLVKVGPEEALYTNKIRIKELNWVGDSLQYGEELKLKVRIRSTDKVGDNATLIYEGDGNANVILEKSIPATSPGQACVFYEDNRMLGGGWIIK